MSKYINILIVILVGISVFSPINYFRIDSSLADNEPEVKANIPLDCPAGIRYINADGFLAICPTDSVNKKSEIKTGVPLDCPSGERYIDKDGFLAICPTKNKPVVNIIYEKIVPIIKNTPMEKMAEDISKREKPVAALLVAIAMKESKFGKYSPKKDGTECYNYWGYRGKENPTKSGYSCFLNPANAVEIVGNRIEELVKNGAKTPADMIIWKCGYSCAGHSPESVRKWIADVGINYYRINTKEELAKK